MGLDAQSNRPKQSSEALADDPKTQLHDILSKPISPENIDTYLDDALEAVSKLAEKACVQYQALHPGLKIPTITLEGVKRPQLSVLEDAAFIHFQVDSIPEILDLISKKYAALESADRFIQSETVRIADTILPPSDVPTNLASLGQTELHFRDRSNLSNRVRTLLYILTEEGLDLSGITARKGEVGDRMVRRESYVQIDIPALERIALVCDESGNASYMFDTRILKTSQRRLPELLHMTKESLAQLMAEIPGVGSRFVYSTHWVETVRSLLHGDLETSGIASADVSVGQVLPVSLDELDPWRNFATDQDGLHFGAISTIYIKSRLPKQLYQWLRRDATNVRSRHITYPGRPFTGYAYEDVVKKFERHLTLPKVESHGEWSGFYLNPNDGKHYGTTDVLPQRLGVGYKIILRLAETGVSTMSVLGSSGRPEKGYAYEDLLPKVQEFLAIPVVESEGRWKGFYKKDGEYFSSIHGIATELGVDRAPIDRRLKGQRVRTETVRNNINRVTEAYALSDIRTLVADMIKNPST